MINVPRNGELGSTLLILRYAITALAEGRDPGDPSTLADAATVDGIQQAVKH